MVSTLLDNYSRLDSPIRRLPARVKLWVALAGLIATILLPIRQWIFFPAWGVLLVGVAALSKIPAGFLWRRMLFVEPFVLGMAGLAWFQPGGGAVFLGVVMKSTLCLLTMMLLSNTTPFADLLRVMQRCRIPPLLVTTIALMYRYLFVLVNEGERMKRARASRTFTRQRARQWKALAAMAGQLFLRSTERAERIYAAMTARGWK